MPSHQSASDYRHIAKGILEMTKEEAARKACPMSGRRIPEVCAGELVGVFDDMWYACCALLRLDARIIAMPQDEHIVMLAEMTNCKQVFMAFTNIKTIAFQATTAGLPRHFWLL